VTERSLANGVVRASINRAFAGQSALREWPFQPDPDGRFAGVLDVFGDGSLWAIHVPGHTAGSTAYLARTPNGPVLLTGDTCHTAWGWTHDVEPGTFTADHARNADSLDRLRRLVADHPAIQVRLGHQPTPPSALTTR
jgi:N-acyl homoserine lactone hydrolase